jgi:hypothetical protein
MATPSCNGGANAAVDRHRIQEPSGTLTGEPVRVGETVRGSHVDAERRLTGMLREHDVTGIVPDRSETVASFSKTWLDHVSRRVKPNTLKRYRELLVTADGE